MHRNDAVIATLTNFAYAFFFRLERCGFFHPPRLQKRKQLGFRSMKSSKRPATGSAAPQLTAQRPKLLETFNMREVRIARKHRAPFATRAVAARPRAAAIPALSASRFLPVDFRNCRIRPSGRRLRRGTR
jgi:hypothetical protein